MTRADRMTDAEILASFSDGEIESLKRTLAAQKRDVETAKAAVRYAEHILRSAEYDLRETAKQMTEWCDSMRTEMARNEEEASQDGW